jgi:hypothetical protein
MNDVKHRQAGRQTDTQTQTHGFIAQTSCCPELKKKFLNFWFWSFRSCVPEVIDLFAGKAAPGVRES